MRTAIDSKAHSKMKRKYKANSNLQTETNMRANSKTRSSMAKVLSHMLMVESTLVSGTITKKREKDLSRGQMAPNTEVSMSTAKKKAME